MKQDTTPEQTAKLFELGFKPAAKIKKVRTVDFRVEVYNDCSFTIGELLEMLPEVTCRSNNDDIHYYLTIYHDAMHWNIAYRDGDDELCYIFADELIDALYAMILQLKKEGAI